MEITREDIVHLADLSDFALSDAEIDSLGKDLEDIIKYISQLDSLKTDDVEPTYQVFEMENIWRDDKIIDQGVTREQLLALSEKQNNNQVEVPKVL